MEDPNHEWVDGAQYQSQRGQPSSTTTMYQDVPMLAPQSVDAMFTYQSTGQQSLQPGQQQGQAYHGSAHQSFAETPAAQNNFSRYQPPQADARPQQFPAPTFPANNALNIHAAPSTHPDSPPFSAGDLGLTNLVQTQDFMGWIDLAEYNPALGLPLAPSDNVTSVADQSSATASFTTANGNSQRIVWPNAVPASQGMPDATMYNVPTLHHLQNNQYVSPPSQQSSTSTPTIQNPSNNANSLQTQVQQQQQPIDESMQLYYWSQGYPDIPLHNSNQATFPLSSQQPTSPGLGFRSNGTQIDPGHVQQQLNSNQTSISGGTSMHAFPNFNDPSLQYGVNGYPQSGNLQQYIIPANSTMPFPISQNSFRDQTALLQPQSQADQDAQFIAYAMSAPMEARNLLQTPLPPRSDAYHQHTAVAGKMKTLSLGHEATNPSHSGQVLSDLEHYLMASSRYALGERKIVIHTPRVGQRSYGTEKRFLCPPPTASVIGLPWWQSDEKGVLRPPAINISITGEHPVPSSTPFWTTIQNKVYEETAKLRLTAEERPFLGRVSNKGLHISDGVEPKEEKKGRNIKAVMAIHCRQEDGQLGQEIGSFESKEIKIVSKPSKKRSSARTSDLFLQHGTLITLFNRIKAQTSTTKFLAVAPNLRQLTGSDGKPLPLPSDLETTANAFVADHNAWDPFAIWLVDTNKPPPARTERPDTPNAPFPPPSDAISLPSSKVVPIICFNHTVRLQCQSTGLITPVMVIRKVEGPQTVHAFEGTRKENDVTRCPINELPSDPVCQLHKIAFELYAPPVAPQSPVYGSDLRSPGSWLSCDQEGIAFRPGISARNWTSAPSTPPSRGSLTSSLPPSPGNHMSALQPMTPRSVVSNSLPSAPTSPATIYSPSLTMSNSGQLSTGDYFAATRHHSSGSSTPYTLASPLQTPNEDLNESNGPGPVRRRRTSSGASYASIRPNGVPTPLMRPPPPRKRGSQQSIHGGDKKDNDSDGLLWTIDVAESATWTIVGAESKTYTFWIPPHVERLSSPVTPFPALHKYIPPGVAADSGHHVDKRYPGQFTTLVDAPLATFYGSGLGKKLDGEPLQVVYYGTYPAKHNEVRCQEVMNASVPDIVPTPTLERKVEPVPIFLVKTNGECIYPTPLTWTG